MFGFFRTAEVFEFADTVATEYDRMLRSTAVRHDTASKKEQKFDKLVEKIDVYSREQKLNFYKKSRMLFAIKQGLAKKGIPEADIDTFLGRLMMRGFARR